LRPENGSQPFPNGRMIVRNYYAYWLCLGFRFHSLPLVLNFQCLGSSKYLSKPPHFELRAAYTALSTTSSLNGLIKYSTAPLPNARERLPHFHVAYRGTNSLATKPGRADRRLRYSGCRRPGLRTPWSKFRALQRVVSCLFLFTSLDSQ
jgi:hypothetical protein